MSGGTRKILVVVFFALVGFATHALAQGFVPLAPIPNLTEGAVANSKNLANFLNNLYKYLIGLAATLAVIQIMWAGFEIAVNKEDVSKITDSKGKIYNALLGLILVLSPVLVFSIINPNILNLSLKLPELDTKSATAPTTGGGAAAQNDTTGCSVTGTAGILQFATCPSGTAAQEWGQKNCTKGILSAITAVTKNPDGTIASSRLSCTQSNIFEFIDVHTGTSLPPNQLRPLAVASNARINGSSTLYQTNGVDAIQYANICRSVGGKTCISNAPSLTFSHACDPMPQTALPAAAPSPAKCYTETLTCEDASVANPYCVSSPSWTPFQ
jgi:hypothetical protein